MLCGRPGSWRGRTGAAAPPWSALRPSDFALVGLPLPTARWLRAQESCAAGIPVHEADGVRSRVVARTLGLRVLPQDNHVLVGNDELREPPAPALAGLLHGEEGGPRHERV